MPKIIAHALAGATIVAALAPKEYLNKWTLLAGAVVAVSPDFDFAVEWLLDLPDFHRGFSHSLIFSFFVGTSIYLILGAERGQLAVALSLAYLSHILLDMATSTAGGVKLMLPFSNEYYHLGLTGIFEIPFGSNVREAFRWIFIETAVFLPIFISTVIIKKLIDKNFF